MTPCRLLRLGLTPYGESLRLQEQLLSQVANGAAQEHLILVEHPHTYTIGRAPAAERHILVPEQTLKAEAEVYRIGRGGDVTYHGPGQLVGYPVMNLRQRGRDVHAYVRALEEVLILTLAEYGIPASREPGLTGVWVGRSKIAAIGIQVRRAVTMHGFALNVTTDLSRFNRIVPCGISDRGVTSIAALLGRDVPLEGVADRLLPHFGRVFRVSIEASPNPRHQAPAH